MLPYTSSFNLRNGIGSMPSTLMMGVSQPNHLPLSLGLNNNLVNKDSQWLTLEVCREYQRGTCPRDDLECKYAHPPPYLENINGRVMCCYDSIKGKCHRVKPPCKYLHPPQHLKDILIQNGKNNLLMKNLQMNILRQQLSSLTGTTTQPRLGLISMNPIFVTESHSSPITLSTGTTSANDQSYSTYCNALNEASNEHCTMSISTECQNKQCQTNHVPSGAPLPMSVSTSASGCLDNRCDAKKRSVAQLYQNACQSEMFTQCEDAVPMKRPMLSDCQLSTVIANREHSLNTMGYMVNPFATYQNPLTTYLALNSQTNLANPGLNIPPIMVNSPHIQSAAPHLICCTPQIGANNLSVIANNIQNQQNLTLMLNAANQLQGQRTLAEFTTSNKH